MSKQRHKRFLDLYKPVHDRFEKFCRARAFADMPHEDLINESLLLAYHKMEELRKESSFLSFLIGISLRILANARKKNRAETGLDQSILHKHADPQHTVEQKFEVEVLHQALAQLPDAQREALILFEITGFSIKEIMEIQQSKESAVKQRLARGRKELAQVVKQLLNIQEGGRHA